MKKLMLVLLFALPAGAQIVPSVTCWSDGGGTSEITIRYGYTNTSASTVVIAAGANNFITPAPAFRSQPTTFLPGTTQSAFIITVPAADAPSTAWTVNGVSASLNLATAPECTSCLCPAGPAGPQGATGPQGPDGPAGPEGPRGAEGATGLRGIQGITGLTGAEGPAGIDGARGPKGATGIAGATGPAGPVGVEGPKGPAGDAGAAGPQGVDGPAGVAGPAGAAGAIGDAGAAGPVGATGGKGPTGPKGLAGVAGPEGPAGAEGAIGPAGFPGDTGARGVDGPRGPNGLASVTRSGRTLFVSGFVNARATSPGSVWLTIDGNRIGVAIPVRATGEWLAIPISLVARVEPGSHVVKAEGSGGVTIGESSLGALPLATEPSSRRRAVRR